MTEAPLEETPDFQSRVILLMNWRRRAIRASNAHYRASNLCRNWSNFLTCFNMLSAISVLFLSNNKFFDDEPSLSGGGVGLFESSDFYTAIASLFVVLTTALQYVLKLEIKVRDFKSAGNDFTNIKREIEIWLSQGELRLEELNSIQIAHTHASRNHQLVPSVAWKAAATQTNEAFQEDCAFEESIRRKHNVKTRSNE